MTEPKLNLGKKKGTIGLGNRVWIKKFENGVKIGKKDEEEITLDRREVYDTCMYLRKFGKKYGYPILLNVVDLTYVWQKYPETKEFIERLLLNEVTFEEKMKIHKIYMTKQKIVENLE